MLRLLGIEGGSSLESIPCTNVLRRLEADNQAFDKCMNVWFYA